MNASPALRRIRPLPSQLANQIAAGEVVERPASVVKELVENSIDAGARRIDVEIRDGGVRLIRVRDDGGGIHPEDLPLALSSHATSKVSTLDELASVLSLGFRGEALASIASVARFTLTSRQTDQPGGFRIDEQGTMEPAAHPPGTTVEVRDLFHNTPARRKFLRSERTEFGHIEEICRRLALARSDVGFTLSHNDRSVFSAAAASDENGREQRLAALAGRGFLRQAFAIHYEGAGLVLHGWVGDHRYSRPQADLQHCFLNGRVIRDRLVSHALRQAYHDVLDPGRHPAWVLYLAVDPERVDVNVHPTKHEVRFRDARMVHDFLVSALRSALHGSTDSPESHSVDESATVIADTAPAYTPGPARTERQPPPDTADGGLLFDRYALVRRGGRQLLVDLAAAWRGHVEAGLERGATPVPLLIPEAVELPAARIDAALESLPGFGFEVDHLGGRALVLRAAPRLFEGLDLKALFDGIPDTGVTLQQVLAERAARARLIEAGGIAGDAFAGLSAESWLPHAVELTPADLASIVERQHAR